ncbi:hypothetical protein [uncultured Cohaesibacter sp.]|uniref:hypothetical protein n=1 Tax=uncultured Cohaesibacter sp. TaxID=1002546 RepID=UPI0029C7B93B|nr:hypothetical protein [uncultured Cohaesibacter sp.]
MDKDRIMQRYFKHGNSFKRIALDYEVGADVIAAICGYGVGARKPHDKGDEPAWFDALDDEFQPLFQWAAEDEGIAIEHLTHPSLGRGARVTIAWQLNHRWGLSATRIGKLLNASHGAVQRMMEEYTGDEPCPINPPLPDMKAEFLDCLCRLARENHVTPMAIWRGTRGPHRHLKNLFLGQLVHELCYSRVEVVKYLGVDRKHLREASEAYGQSIKTDRRRKSRKTREASYAA